MCIIAPSLLEADYKCLGEQLKTMEKLRIENNTLPRRYDIRPQHCGALAEASARGGPQYACSAVFGPQIGQANSQAGILGK